MLQEQRHQLILQYLRENGSLSVNDLISLLGVSRETVRRDLAEMHQLGLLTKVHGGAVLRKVGEEPSYASRSVLHLSEKKSIAARALQLLDAGDTIFIDNGTTALEFARLLPSDKNLTVLTHSVPVATTVVERGIKVYLTGGLLRQGELSLSGGIANDVINGFFVDKAFIGAGGVSPSHGITDFHVEESDLRRKVASKAAKRIILADHSKLDVTVFVSVLPVDLIDILVTDSQANPDVLKSLEMLGVEVVVAE
jgi:DeoR/GlpR family transcriptional regulator of sugar metabolism